MASDEGSTMVASVFIAEPDRSRLARIDSIGNLDGFTCVELDTMTSVEFASIVGDDGIEWHEGEPIRFDAETGVAILKVSEEGVRCVLERKHQIDAAMQSDLRKLIDFVRLHGQSILFEVTHLPDWTKPVEAQFCDQCGAPLEIQLPMIRSKTGEANRYVHLALCAECAEHYDDTSNRMMWGMAAFVAIVVIVGLGGCVLRWLVR
jgi:hypothetical protein